MSFKSIDSLFSITGFYSAFSFSWNEHFHFKGEMHNRLWEIVLITSGKVNITEDEKIYTLEKNQMILHAPREFHSIGSAENTNPSGYVMSFGADGILPETLKNGVFVLEEGEMTQFIAIVERIMTFLTQESLPSYWGQEASNLLSAFLIHLIGKKAESTVDNSVTATAYRQIVSIMTERVKDNFALEDFASLCNISVSYIKQLFHQYCGVSPKAYYNNLRIRYARKCLEDGWTIAQVANEMNFSSPNYFSAFFKKKTGLSPLAYKTQKGGS
ncbi:MAG: helix-turn-helix domain-containing protein [Ruminococcaceae bacterium]|nr:helix-turn-helix domain-containing protein [Oscillospiraceae bacterium]